MKPISPVPRDILAASERRTSRLTIKRAETPEELQGLFRLNYRTYVEELGQDARSETGALVDPFHDSSVYFIAKDGQVVVGMAAITLPGHTFSMEKSLADPSIIWRLRDRACEFRRLALHAAYRRSGLYVRLVEALAQYCVQHDIPCVFIAAIERHVGLYAKLGFEPFDRPFSKGRVRYQPMMHAAKV
ncbi:MAG: GNAT family N-acetyltransferase [Vicinamibacteraceae bacterium]